MELDWVDTVALAPEVVLAIICFFCFGLVLTDFCLDCLGAVPPWRSSGGKLALWPPCTNGDCVTTGGGLVVITACMAPDRFNMLVSCCV